MRIFLTFLSILFLSATVASAADTGSVSTLSSPIYDTVKAVLPKASAGMIYNLQSHEANFITVGSLAEKDTKIGTFTLDLGYGESDSVMSGISYKTETLEKLGIKTFILKDLFAKVGYGICMDHITSESEFGHGPTATFGASYKY